MIFQLIAAFSLGNVSLGLLAVNNLISSCLKVFAGRVTTSTGGSITSNRTVLTVFVFHYYSHYCCHIYRHDSINANSGVSSSTRSRGSSNTVSSINSGGASSTKSGGSNITCSGSTSSGAKSSGSSSTTIVAALGTVVPTVVEQWW